MSRLSRFLCAFLLESSLISLPGWASPLQSQTSLASALVTQDIAQASPTPTQGTRVDLNIDLNYLRSQLEAQNWQAADAATRRILQPWIHPGGDLYGSPLATNIPPELLQTLDQLWTEASDGRFGFSVQKRIWDEVRSQHPEDTDIATRAFGDRVGWTRPMGSAENGENFVSPEWLTEPELNYSLEAPAGHLPWAGVDWEQIIAILNVQSCGSCMIDAMYLQSERFNRYLPTLFNWLTTALEATIPPTDSWEQAQLTHSIELQALYSNPNCPVDSPAQAISPDSMILAVSSYSYERSCNPGSGNSTLALWNIQQGNRIITLVRGQATESFSYRGQAQEPPTESTRIVGDIANAVAFSPDSRFVAAGLSNGTIRLWTTDKGEATQTLSGHPYAVRAIAISPDGQRLFSASSDQTIKLWNLQTGQLIRTITLRPEDGIVHALLISPNGQRLATATDRNALQLWDVQTGQLIRSFVEPASDTTPRLPIAFSPDGQKLATGDRDQSIKLWNANSGARLITLRSHTEAVHHLTFSPNSQTLASSEAKTAYLWNLQTYQPVHRFDLVQTAGHPVMPDNLSQVSFSPDGKVLAVNTLLLPLVESEPIPRQGISLWEVETGRILKQIHQVAQFQFSPNGQFLIANGQNIQIWRIRLKP